MIIRRQAGQAGGEEAGPGFARGSGWTPPVWAAAQSGLGGVAAAPTSFVGRVAEIAEVAALLEKCRL